MAFFMAFFEGVFAASFFAVGFMKTAGVAFFFMAGFMTALVEVRTTNRVYPHLAKVEQLFGPENGRKSGHRAPQKLSTKQSRSTKIRRSRF